ncbi:MAG TPA: adenosine deaminase [Rhodospirillales bacterium]
MPRNDFIDRLPKAELHVHVEGTLEPEMMLALAARNHISIPYDTVEQIAAAYRFNNLQDFLDLYYQGVRVLRTERDFHDLTRAYLDRAHRQNVLHAEIFFDPQAHTERGVEFRTVIDGIRWALWDAKADLGLTTRLILCFLRHLPPESAMQTLEHALPYRDDIAGVGLDSSELGNPPEKFAEVFERARAEGFHAVAHAGEEGPPEYVAQALDVLHAERIDHGNRALEDPALVRRLVNARVPLTLCPLSNLRLGVVHDMAKHPLRRMLNRGLRVTVNSDDPAYFGGYINENYRAVADALDLDQHELYTLARNGFEAAFLPAEKKRKLIGRLDAAAGRAAAA